MTDGEGEVISLMGSYLAERIEVTFNVRSTDRRWSAKMLILSISRTLFLTERESSSKIRTDVSRS